MAQNDVTPVRPSRRAKKTNNNNNNNKSNNNKSVKNCVLERDRTGSGEPDGGGGGGEVAHETGLG